MKNIILIIIFAFSTNSQAEEGQKSGVVSKITGGGLIVGGVTLAKYADSIKEAGPLNGSIVREMEEINSRYRFEFSAIRDYQQELRASGLKDKDIAAIEAKASRFSSVRALDQMEGEFKKIVKGNPGLRIETLRAYARNSYLRNVEFRREHRRLLGENKGKMALRPYLKLMGALSAVGGLAIIGQYGDENSDKKALSVDDIERHIQAAELEEMVADGQNAAVTNR